MVEHHRPPLEYEGEDEDEHYVGRVFVPFGLPIYTSGCPLHLPPDGAVSEDHHDEDDELCEGQ